MSFCRPSTDTTLNPGRLVPGSAASYLYIPGQKTLVSPLSSSRLRLDLASESVQGRRPYNEDSFLTETLDDGRVLLAVADGMGGHAAGEVASALALEVLRESVTSGETLDEGCRRANRRVHAKAGSEPGKQGMGTTLVTALVEGNEFLIANVGDSRAYLVTSDGFRQITDDHSFVAEAVKRGQPEAEALESPWKDVLTRSIGIDAEVEVDLFGPVRLEEDTAVLLCSDGLFKALDEGRLFESFATSTDAKDAASALVSAAYDAGSDDNITLVVAEQGRVPRRTPAPAGQGSTQGGAATLRMEPLDSPIPEDAPSYTPDPPRPARAFGPLAIATLLAFLAVAATAVLLLAR